MNTIALGRYGKFAPPNEATNGYLLDDNGERIIIDFGSGCMSNSLKHTDFCDVKAIIISHLHYDHMSDLYTLGYYLMATKVVKKIALYLPRAPYLIVDSLKGLPFEIHHYSSGEHFQLACFDILAVDAQHTIECYSLVINGKLIYTADTDTMDNLIPYLNDDSTVIGDACHLASDCAPKGIHITVKALAQAMPIGATLYLAHLAYGQEQEILCEAKSEHDLSYIMPSSFTISS